MIYDLLALTPLSLHDVRNFEGWSLYSPATRLELIEGPRLLRAMGASKQTNLGDVAEGHGW